MGFYELGNGCDSCESVSPILPQNVNMSMDPNSSMASGMMMPYNPTGNAMKQYNGGVTAGYPQGNNMGSMGNGSTGGSLAGQPQAVKQVTTTVTTTSVPNAPAANTNAPAQKVEGFTSGSTTSNMMMKSGKHWVVLGLVIFCALAANECCKYFLNKSIQLDGSPMYYVAYVGVAVLLTYAVNTYVSNN
jgi:hypothetical protein